MRQQQDRPTAGEAHARAAAPAAQQTAHRGLQSGNQGVEVG